MQDETKKKGATPIDGDESSPTVDEGCREIIDAAAAPQTNVELLAEMVRDHPDSVPLVADLRASVDRIVTVARACAVAPHSRDSLPTMTASTRAAVWLDHHEARVFHVDLDGFDEQTLRAPTHHFHRHPKGPSEPHAHPDDEHRFFAEVAKALATAEEILVLGPSTAKAAFLRYLEGHHPGVTGKVVGVETTDHPTDGQIVAHVRTHFRIPSLRVH
jgi:hypothetical protein